MSPGFTFVGGHGTIDPDPLSVHTDVHVVVTIQYDPVVMNVGTTLSAGTVQLFVYVTVQSYPVHKHANPPQSTCTARLCVHSAKLCS